jgi:hypothetical protein
MNSIVNLHVIDPTNIGDRLSSPIQYFDFSGFTTQALDIREFDPSAIQNSHTIVGGGGLIYSRFQPYFDSLRTPARTGKLIAWGIGQQSYDISQKNTTNFDYAPYLKQFDLVGIRDFNHELPWLPCVSCMHPAFDQNHNIQHDIVVFSHKKFQLNIPGLPTMTNAGQNFEQVLEFLASGETILTSSYHGAYWGTLLGRKVLAFPFSSKFYTLKHLPTSYPVDKWKQGSWQISLFKKQLYKHWYKNKFFCDTQGWQDALQHCRSYPESLGECREQNRRFYHQCMDQLTEIIEN